MAKFYDILTRTASFVVLVPESLLPSINSSSSLCSNFLSPRHQIVTNFLDNISKIVQIKIGLRQ
uniref:Uncharacterized protein n=1 Tax=Romanomermis culicivorax TaxID=13658 RepID=A0A915IDA4_ROMCU